MYALNDTIAAVSSPTPDKGTILRLTGSDTVGTLNKLFKPAIAENQTGITHGKISVDSELHLDAKLFLFTAGNSYTGETLAEIHLYTNSSVTEALMKSLLEKGLRTAGPGEFTARAYLNGKINLAQAEAVNKVITSSNRLQLAAAEQLLSGRLSETTAKVQSQLLDCLSLIEAGLDFSGEDIEFISKDDAVSKLQISKSELESLLSGSISYERVVDLPSVGIAGAPNAGKSSLLNKLLGIKRSIVSEQRKTTRDVLTGLLKLEHCQCVLFDCAGLIPEPDTLIDELTQQAAAEALGSASIVIFCVDLSKTDWAEDINIHTLIKPEILIPLATKSDLVDKKTLADKLTELNKLFAEDFSPVSVITDEGLESLCKLIDEKIITLSNGMMLEKSFFSETKQNGVALTARHKQAVTSAIENISESIDEIKADKDEVATMMLRAAYQGLSNIAAEHIDEKVLENIFSRFCIGK